MNKPETKLKNSLQAIEIQSNADSSWWEHALQYFVCASLSGLLFKATQHTIVCRNNDESLISIKCSKVCTLLQTQGKH